VLRVSQGSEPSDKPTDIEYPLLGALIGQIRSRLRQSPNLARDTFWTLLNNVLAVLSGVALFKAIAIYVPPPEYGKASLVLGVIALLSQFIAGPTIQAQFRLYFEHAAERSRQFVAAAARLLLLVAAVMGVIYLGIAAAYRTAGNPVYWQLAFAAVVLLFLNTHLTGTFGLLEAQRRYRGLTIAQSLNKVLQVVLFLLLLRWTGAEAKTILYSQAAAAVVVIIVWTARQGWRSDAQPSGPLPSLGRDTLKSFGWSLYLLSLFSWVLTISDRYIIDFFLGVKEVGRYSINYGFWSIPYLVLNGWLEMMTRSRMYEKAEAGDWQRVRTFIHQRFAAGAALGIAGTGLIGWQGKRLALLVIGESYWVSAELMLLLAIAHCFFVLAMAYFSLFIAAKRTHTMTWITLACCALNVACNLWLVPSMGIVGAAWSTLAGYAALCLLFLWKGTSLLKKLQTGS
jgi:O-antigen/teichoic acid export membrane protein